MRLFFSVGMLHDLVPGRGGYDYTMDGDMIVYSDDLNKFARRHLQNHAGEVRLAWRGNLCQFVRIRLNAK